MNNHLLYKFKKLHKLGQRILSSNILSDTTWILLDQADSKTVFIFKSDRNTLLLSKDGNITKGTWEFIVDNDNLILEVESKNELYNISMIEDNFILLQKDGSEDYKVLANYTKFKDQLKSTIIKLFDDLIKTEKTKINQKVRNNPEVESQNDYELLKREIHKAKRAWFITNDKIERINFYLNRLAPTKEEGLKMLIEYKKQFKEDLLEELRRTSTSFDNLNKIFAPIIKIDLVDNKHPFILLD